MLFNIIGYFFDCRYISSFAATKQADDCELRNRLLMEAIDKIGLSSPEAAAKIWAEGVKSRNAALQFSVMSESLKKNYVNQLEQTAPNWVTGVSSPWISEYKIVEMKKIPQNRYTVKVLFNTATSTGPAADYNALLTLAEERDFWRIADIQMDEGLFAYTGFENNYTGTAPN